MENNYLLQLNKLGNIEKIISDLKDRNLLTEDQVKAALVNMDEVGTDLIIRTSLELGRIDESDFNKHFILSIDGFSNGENNFKHYRNIKHIILYKELCDGVPSNSVDGLRYILTNLDSFEDEFNKPFYQGLLDRKPGI